MVIRPAGPAGYSLASLLDTSSHRPWLNRNSALALGGAALLHLALIAYLYNQHFAGAPPAPPTPVDASTVISMVPLPDTEPRRAKPTPIERVRQTSTPVVPDTPTVAPHPVTTKATTTSTDPFNPPVVTTNTGGGGEPVAPGPRVIRDPTWIRMPSGADVNRVYPERAITFDKTGSALVQCSVTASGDLTRCTALSETPEHFGFASAALKLVQRYQMSPRTEDGRPVDGAVVQIPIKFRLEG